MVKLVDLHSLHMEEFKRFASGVVTGDELLIIEAVFETVLDDYVMASSGLVSLSDLKGRYYGLVTDGDDVGDDVGDDYSSYMVFKDAMADLGTPWATDIKNIVKSVLDAYKSDLGGATLVDWLGNTDLTGYRYGFNELY